MKLMTARLAASTLVISAALAGCGSDESSSPSPTSTTTCGTVGRTDDQRCCSTIGLQQSADQADRHIAW